MRFLTHSAVLLLTASASFGGQDPSPLPPGAKLYIAPMEWQMEQFITSEIHRQGLAVNLVTDESEADFVMTGSAEKLSSHFMAPGRCFQVTIVTADRSKTIWTGQGDDYATVFGRLRSHGPNRAARVIVDGIRSRFFKKPR